MVRRPGTLTCTKPVPANANAHPTSPAHPPVGTRLQSTAALAHALSLALARPYCLPRSRSRAPHHRHLHSRPRSHPGPRLQPALRTHLRRGATAASTVARGQYALSRVLPGWPPSPGEGGGVNSLTSAGGRHQYACVRVRVHFSPRQELCLAIDAVDISAAWAGGPRGRLVLDRCLPHP